MSHYLIIWQIIAELYGVEHGKLAAHFLAEGLPCVFDSLFRIDEAKEVLHLAPL